VFPKKSLEFLDYKGVDAFGGAKERAKSAQVAENGLFAAETETQRKPWSIEVRLDSSDCPVYAKASWLQLEALERGG
jgi:hypothetical protein